jgi:hypothetical protein
VELDWFKLRSLIQILRGSLIFIICGIIEYFIVGTMIRVARYLRSSSRCIHDDVVAGAAGADAVTPKVIVVVGLLLSPESTVVWDASDASATSGSTTPQSRSPCKMVLTL